MSTYIQGDTVKLRASFYNWAGAPYNPTNVRLKIYKDGRDKVGTTIEGALITNAATAYSKPSTLSPGI